MEKIKFCIVNSIAKLPDPGINQHKRSTKSIYQIYIVYTMVKTVRLSNDELHTELMKIQGKIQSESGKFTSMDDVMGILIKTYKKKK